MTRQELERYLQEVVAAHRPPFFIERLFRTNEEWDRLSAYELRNVSLSERTEVDLADLLSHRLVTILGEPGSGKSTVARAAVPKAASKGFVPLFGSLRSYGGDLGGLLATNAPAGLVAGELVDGASVTRLLVLDGFDEIPPEQLERFVEDLTTLLARDPNLRLVLTARQAFYEVTRKRFANPSEAFYLLGFKDRDIREYVRHFRGDYDAFMAEVNRVELGQEITNPFALELLFRAFQEEPSLGNLRYQAVDRVVESLIASRPNVSADRQRRALRMLAVAMETASRNELAVDDAVTLLRSATRLTADEAEALLNELTYSILVRTPNGLSFQMRSYGEYLAAVELQHMSLDKVLMLVRLPDSLILNESWRNCVSYLAELHSGVRRQFSITHPDWMMSVSPNAFTEAERTIVLRRLLTELAREQRYLWHHPALATWRVARFVTPEVERELLADATGLDVSRAGNAIILLGAARKPAIIPIALPVALDQTRPQLLRGSAIAALSIAGDATLIPTLIAGLNDQDQLNLSLIDCIGSLTDAASIPAVLPLLLRTDAMVTGAFYRFQELQNAAAVDQLLDVLTANPGMLHSTRIDSYAKPLWNAMVEQWDTRWAAPLAQLIVTLEVSHAYDRDGEPVIEVLERLGNNAEDVVRRVLAGLLATNQRLFTFRRAIAQLVSPAVAEWLAAQPNSIELMQPLHTERQPKRG